MVSLNRRWLGGFAVAVALFPGGVHAQTTARSFDELQGILKAEEIVVVFDHAGNKTPLKFAESLSLSSAQAAPQGATGKAMTRGKKIAIGAGIGGGVGVLVGEYYFGRKLDMAHGPDMLGGAGIGAGAGALIAWALTGGESGASNSKSSVGVAPVLSPSRKALVVTLALK
jgi:hypothetical protein